MSPPLDHVLRWTRFASNSDGTGPEKRSAQIRALCSAVGVSIEDMRPPESAPRIETWIRGLQARVRFGRYASVDRAGIGLLGYRSTFYRHALRGFAGKKVLLWETTYDTMLPAYAKAAGFGLIALPHNLESLVSEQSFSNPECDRMVDLSAELLRLRLADSVFTISKEEQWFLEAHRIVAHYLPFYPDESLTQASKLIRTQRTQRANANGHVAGPLLILGSAFNPATCLGMAEQLRWLTRDPAMPFNVVVVGPETERRLSEFQSSQVKILGAVSRAVLTDQLASCSALLIHTQGGAGAVTRIPEALIAGIPVIANRNASRDQHGTPGVHVYDDEQEFFTLARAPLPMPPTLARPIGAENRFQQELLRLKNSVSSHA